MEGYADFHQAIWNVAFTANELGIDTSELETEINESNESNDKAIAGNAEMGAYLQIKAAQEFLVSKQNTIDPREYERLNEAYSKASEQYNIMNSASVIQTVSAQPLVQPSVMASLNGPSGP